MAIRAVVALELADHLDGVSVSDYTVAALIVLTFGVTVALGLLLSKRGDP